MQRLLLTCALAVALTASARADGPPAMLLPGVPGASVHLRITHVAQTAEGPATTTTAFDLVRKTGTTLLLERSNADGSPNLSVLTQAADGSVGLAEGARGAVADADLADALYGLNLAIAATRAADPAGKIAWTATIPLAPGAGAATAIVSVEPVSAAAEFDFGGQGQGFANPAPRRASEDPLSIGGGFPHAGGGAPGGGVGGGGFPGGPGGGPGGGPPRRGGGEGDAPPRGANPVLVRIDGHVSAGRVTRVSITQTRSVTIAGLPYTNVGNWTVAAGK